jgi:RNA polymerase sigma factor (sigma-70 family)
MSSDVELLQRYAQDQAEDAFEELVRRHIDRVYSAALRRVGGDAFLAEDVVQQVFVALARKAAWLSRHPILLGWLHLATRNEAANVVRSERRRKNREREAQTMMDTHTPGTDESAWSQVAPVLDDALDQLSDRDRTAVLFRFAEQRAFAEMGAILQLSEDAARRRVDRALEKLQVILARRGVTSTAAVLGLALANQIVVAAPAALAGTVTSTALAGAAASAGLFSTVTFMSMTKLKLGLAAAVLVAGSTTIVLQQKAKVALRHEVETLRRQNSQLAQPHEENGSQPLTAGELQTARNAQAEIVRLRTELDALKNRATEPKTSSSSEHATQDNDKVPLAPGLVAVATLNNVGRATPRATFETQLWATHRGDVDTTAAAITLEPEARVKLAELLATLPENLRAEYGTPERLMAFVLAGSPHPVGGMQVLGETQEGADSVVLHTKWQHEDDTLVHRTNARFQRGTDGWRLVVPTSLADRAAAYLTKGRSTQSTGP